MPNPDNKDPFAPQQDNSVFDSIPEYPWRERLRPMTEPTNQPAAELKPCPFCGGTAEQRLTDGPKRGFIGCFTCMIGTPYNVPYGEREREAWNTRTQPLCPLHNSLYNKLEVVVGHNCIACSLNERAAMLDMLAPFAPADGSKDSLQVLQSVIEYTRHQPPAVPLDARERAREIVASATETRYITPEQYIDVLCRESTLIDRIAAALTTTPAASGPLVVDLALPEWITNLIHVRSDALMQAADANKKGDDFRHGYHSGRAQVLDSWIESAQVGVTTNAATGAQTCPHLHQTFPDTPAVNRCLDCGELLRGEFPATTTAAEQSSKEPWKDVGGHEWEIKQNVTCVECPHCLFTFAAFHTVKPEDYDCPNCDGCPDAAKPAATPSISAAIAEVKKLRDEWRADYNATNDKECEEHCSWMMYAADEILERLRALQPSTPSESVYLDCAMCDASKSFVIDPNDEAVGYCFREKKAWRISIPTEG